MYKKIKYENNDGAAISYKKHYYIEAILIILLFFLLTIIFYQHNQINRYNAVTIYQPILDKKLLNRNYERRVKRSINEKTFNNDINNDLSLTKFLPSTIEYSVNAPTLPNYSATSEANKILNTNFNNQPYFVPLYAQLLVFFFY